MPTPTPAQKSSYTASKPIAVIPMSQSPIEITTFLTERSRLVAQDNGANIGKYVLIQDSKISGILATEDEAYDIGFDKFGNDSFLVQKIEPNDPKLSVAMILVSDFSHPV